MPCHVSNVLGTKIYKCHSNKNIDHRKSVKLAWSMGFDLFRVRRVARARVMVGVRLGIG